MIGMAAAVFHDGAHNDVAEQAAEPEKIWNGTFQESLFGGLPPCRFTLSNSVALNEPRMEKTP